MTHGPPGSQHEELRACLGSLTARGPPATRIAPPSAWPSASVESVGTPNQNLRGSIACLHDPYRRFAAALASSRRTAQGHRVSLPLRCRELASPSSMPVVRRFPTVFSQCTCGRFEASPRRATPEGQTTSIASTAPHSAEPPSTTTSCLLRSCSQLLHAGLSRRRHNLTKLHRHQLIAAAA